MFRSKNIKIALTETFYAWNCGGNDIKELNRNTPSAQAFRYPDNHVDTFSALRVTSPCYVQVLAGPDADDSCSSDATPIPWTHYKFVNKCHIQIFSIPAAEALGASPRPKGRIVRAVQNVLSGPFPHSHPPRIFP